MKAYLYRLDCLTNLHVGSGDINYSIIDNEVERDPVTGEPTIHASGVKGALRDYCSEEARLEKNTLREIFGQEVNSGKDDSNGDKIIPGKYKFLGASIAARPLRVSKGNATYINATTPVLVDNLVTLINAFGIALNGGATFEKQELKVPNDDRFVSNMQDIEIEDKSVVQMESIMLQRLIGDNYAVTAKLEEYKLPIIARNQLNNGRSNNLWHEEFVPHESVFYFIVLTLDNEVNKLPIDGKVIQFGGSASVGCGYCKVTKAGESI